MKEMVGQKELQKRVERTSGPARTPTTESKELKKYGTIFVVPYGKKSKESIKSDCIVKEVRNYGKKARTKRNDAPALQKRRRLAHTSALKIDFPAKNETIQTQTAIIGLLR